MKPQNIAKNLGLTLATVLIVAAPAMAQDVKKGERVFKKCKACHAIGEGAKNKTGPELNGVLGRVAGGLEGFKYSSVMAESGLTWDTQTLAQFLADPKEYLKGTKMGFAGLKKETDIVNVIAYLDQFNADGTMK